MATPDVGKTIGRVSIKVLPDTKDFRRKLEEDLRKKRVQGIPIEFDKAKVDREKIRGDIERQMRGLGTARTEVDVVPHVDDVNINKTKVRKSIHDQLNQMGIKLDVYPHVKNGLEFRREVERALHNLDDTKFDVILKVKDQEFDVKPKLDKNALDKVRNELYAMFGDDENGKRVVEFATKLDEKSKLEFEHSMNKLVNKYDGKGLSINAQMNLLMARARLTTFLRTRDMTIWVNISKKSLALARAEMLKFAAAASGTRLLGDWIDDITSAFKNLDRNAPMIIGVTSIVGSAIAGIAAAGAGLISVGGDIAKIGPALLVIPGIAMNAVSSLVVIGVALKSAGDELSSLTDHMNVLGNNIRYNFWDQAREPIIRLVNDLFPQLQNVMRETARATGGFAAEMANALNRHLGNGRLEGIFEGIVESWDILADGADGFAGALVNLSEIGARYMPGLAQWFVDLADDFDAWLTKVSTSDQLDTWISNAVDEMGYLWDAAKNAWGVIEGLYDAANKAGATGLKGLADVLGDWNDVVNSVPFQDGLSAIFTGSMGAMGAFADAIKAIGDLIGKNADSFEKLLESAGGFAGGLIEAIADALNSPTVIAGMDAFSEGLTEGIEKISPLLTPLADTFGDFLSLLGNVASDLLPSVIEALGNLTPVLDAIIKPIQDALPELGTALVEITESLGPAVADLAGALSEAAISAIQLLADAIIALEPAITPLVDILAQVVDRLATYFGGNDALDGPEGLQFNTPGFKDQIEYGKVYVEFDDDMKKILDQGISVDMVADVEQFIRSFNISGDKAKSLRDAIYTPDTKDEFQDAAEELSGLFLDEYSSVLDLEGADAANSLLLSIQESDLPQKLKDQIFSDLQGAGNDTSIVEKEAIDRQIGELIHLFEVGGLDAAQAYWDNMDPSERAGEWGQYMYDALVDQGIYLETEFGSQGEKMVGLFGEKAEGAIVPALSKVGSTAQTAIAQAFEGVTLATGETGLAAAEALGEGLSSGTPGVQEAIAALKQAGLVDPMADLETLMAEPAGGVILGLISGLESGTVGVTDATGQMVQAGIVDQFNLLSSVMPGVGADTIVGLIDGMNGQSGALSGASEGLKQSGIADQFTAMSQLLPNAGAETILGLIEGITSQGGVLGSTAEEIKRSGILDKFVDASGMLTDEGRAIVGGLSSGITDGRGLVDGVIGSLRQNGIIDRFADASYLLPEKGKQIAAGLAAGIDGSRSFVSGVVDLFRHDGVESPFDGIEDRFGDIGGRLSGRLASSIEGGRSGVYNASASLRADGVMDAFSGIDHRFGDIGSSIGTWLGVSISNARWDVRGHADALRSDGVMDAFSGIDQRFGDIARSIGEWLGSTLRNQTGTVLSGARDLRANGVMDAFGGIDSRFGEIGSSMSGALSAALRGGAYDASMGAKALSDGALSGLSGLVSAAGSIGEQIFGKISYWVGQAKSFFSGLTSAQSSVQSSINSMQKTALVVSGPQFQVQSLSASVSDQADAFTMSAQSNIAATAAYRPSFSALSIPDVLPPANVNVTMPLLPGETPGEQRDNVVRELRRVL